MIEIGGRPILWHIMKIYAHYGINDFVICLGYKGYFIKEYFANYFLHKSDVTFDTKHNRVTSQQSAEPWRMTLVDTGEQTMTGGRLKRVAALSRRGRPFFFTYGDGVADVDIEGADLDSIKATGGSRRVTAVAPPGRYGALELAGATRYAIYREKPPGRKAIINGGFFVLEPRGVIERIDGDETSFEGDTLDRAGAGRVELVAYRHAASGMPWTRCATSNMLEEHWRSRRSVPGRCGVDGLRSRRSGIFGVANAYCSPGIPGSKAAWMSCWLRSMGAQVSGLALAPDTSPNMFTLVRAGEGLENAICDLRDADAVAAIVAIARPDIVIHMAAQALVRRSVADPSETFATNVTGTVNLFEALRRSERLRVVLAVTTDKVYDNGGTCRTFVESDPLGGHDPYSASKAAMEIVVQSFARTYFEPAGIAVATARGGNVVGGGDFSEDRIVPDIWRAMSRGEPIRLRYPHAVRPWQHVLDCLAGYLCFAQALAGRRVAVRTLNFGPNSTDRMTVADLTTKHAGRARRSERVGT